MRTEQKTKLRVALHDVMTKRHGHSLTDRLAALEHLASLLTEVLLTEPDPSAQRRKKE